MRPNNSRNFAAYAALLRDFGVSEFSLCMGHRTGTPGYLIWNDNSTARHPTAFRDVKLTQSTHWLAQLENVRVGNYSINCSQGCGAIVDSGTSLLAAPVEVLKEMENIVDNLDTSCSNLHELPDLRFTLGGVELSLPPSSYVGTVYGDVPANISSNFRRKANNSCQATLMTVSTSSPLGATWILGLPFFRKYYCSFRQQGPDRSASLKVAMADNDCQPVSNPVSKFSHGKAQRELLALRVNAARLRLPSWAALSSSGERSEI